MLDKKELKQVQEVVATTISDLFKSDLFPFLQEKFVAIDKRFNENSEEHEEMFERLDTIEKGIFNHEKRIQKLEAITQD